MTSAGAGMRRALDRSQRLPELLLPGSEGTRQRDRGCASEACELSGHRFSLGSSAAMAKARP